MRFAEFISLLENIELQGAIEPDVVASYQKIHDIIRSLPNLEFATKSKFKFKFNNRLIIVNMMKSMIMGQTVINLNIDFQWSNEKKFIISKKDTVYPVGNTLQQGSLDFMRWLKQMAIKLAKFPVHITFVPILSDDNSSRRENFYSKILISAGYVPADTPELLRRDFKGWMPKWLASTVFPYLRAS